MCKLPLVVLLCLIALCFCHNEENILRQRCIKENGERLHISFTSILSKGHINPLIGSAQQLARLGCRVTIPVSKDKLDWVTPYEEIEPLVIEVKSTELSVADRRESTNTNGIFDSLKVLTGAKPNTMKKLLWETVKPIFEALYEEHKQGRYQPDILVSDKIAAPLFDLAEVIGSQPIVLNPSLIFSFDTFNHFLPVFGTNFPVDMSYGQRVVNSLIMPTAMDLLGHFLTSCQHELRAELGITDKVSPWLVTSNFTGLELSQTFFGLEYPQPLPPNHILVGPVLPLTLKKLPENIDKWINEHNDKPIVYMCMGTVATITPQSIQELMSAFTGENYYVLWSFPENQRDVLEGINIPSNVHLEKFVPQRELLLREEIKVFISHTGASSANEAVLAGVPVVCIPFFGDQFEYCHRLVRAGAALPLDKSNLLVSDISNAVDKVLNDKSFVNNALRLKKLALLNGGALKVAESILSAYHDGVEHLVTYNHFLPWPQNTAFDLRLTQFLFTFFLPFVLYYLFKILRLCCCCCCRKKKQSTTNPPAGSGTGSAPKPKKD